MQTRTRETKQKMVRAGLMMTRKHKEIFDLVLADGSEITVTTFLRGDRRARLHVAAPPEVRIIRRELRERETSAA